MAIKRVPSNRAWASAAIALLAAVAVGGGLALDGGPWEARKERRNDVRRDDLQRLSSQVVCLAETAQGRLPQDIMATDACPGRLRLNDPFTDAPYRYETIDAATYRLCAGLEPTRRPVPDWRSTDWDEARGCLIGRTSLPSATGLTAGTYIPLTEPQAPPSP